MTSNYLRAAIMAISVSLGWGQAAWGQTQAPASAASAPIPYAQIPLQRDAAADGSTAASAGWAALFLAVLAGAGFVVARRKSVAGPGKSGGWLRRAESAQSTPKPLGRLPLTPQASLHVIEWQGEELLLGCTSQAVSVLARHPKVDNTKAAS